MTRFLINDIKIDSIKNSSALMNTPNNRPSNWKSFKKENQGFGEINGVEVSLNNLLDIVEDQDVVDVHQP